MLLAGFGLGGLTIAAWADRYRWVFLALTFILIAGAFYKVYRERTKRGPLSLGILYGTTVLCVGLVLYTLVFK